MGRLGFILILMLFSCSQKETLPIFGETSIDKETGELVYYKAPEFQLTNQFNELNKSEDFIGKIQVIDFFFTSCPTICPQMTKHLKLVEDEFQAEERLAIISYSIDSKNDTPKRLRAYSEAYQINNKKWTFLTGSEDNIFEIAKDYKVRAFDDSTFDQVNLIHDGTFVLVDENQRIRGYYNGLSKKDTQKLIKDIYLLIKTL